MANINSRWVKYIASGCSHGHLEDRTAVDAVLGFVDRWKPSVRIHLGDFVDNSAFRSGAPGTKDEAASLTEDMEAGVRLLLDYRATHILNGNHEDRLWNNMFHPSAIRARAAQALVEDIRNAVKKLRAKHIEAYDITDSRAMFRFGDTTFLHGYMFNENGVRDHAEHFGRCVIAHLHTPGEANGRRSDHATATCVGTLADVRKLNYAKNRRSTARWGAGFVWGEFNDRECVVWLAKRNQHGEWRLPL